MFLIKLKYSSFCVVVIFLMVNLLSAQNATVDSLKIELTKAANDTNKVETLLDLSSALFRTEPDSAIIYADQAIELATALDYQKGLGYGLKNKGLAYYIKSDFTEVLNYWRQSLAIFEGMEFKLGISNLLNNLGAVYFSKGDDPKALEYYFGSLRIAEEINDPIRIATAYVNIGAVYVNNDQTYDEALDAYRKALEISEKEDYQSGIGTAAMNLGELYYKKDQLDLAVKYLEKSLESFDISGGDVARAQYYLGSTYLKKNDSEKAVEYQIKAIDNAQKIDSKVEEARAYIGLGDAYSTIRKNNSAYDSYFKALDIAKEIGVNTEKRDAYEGLSLVSAKIGNFEKAFEYQKLYSEAKDNFRTEEYDEKIGNLRFQFDVETKEKEIAILNKDNAIKEAEIEKATIFQKFLYAFAGFLLIIIGGVSYQYWYVKKSNKLINIERNRSESILLNILPKETADELKDNGFVVARKFETTTVLFTDFKNFSFVSENISAEELVESVDYYFRAFDQITDKYNLEKIKTIGDAYMCAGGLPNVNTTNAEDALKAGFEILEFVNEAKRNPPKNVNVFDIRIGINTGRVVAGVVGTKKFQYDIWGSTVNIAARMESNSEPGKINISENTYQYVKDKYECTYRGEIDVKNVGMMKMYFVESPLV